MTKEGTHQVVELQLHRMLRVIRNDRRFKVDYKDRQVTSGAYKVSFQQLRWEIGAYGYPAALERNIGLLEHMHYQMYA
jgi:hypothetical protein